MTGTNAKKTAAQLEGARRRKLKYIESQKEKRNNLELENQQLRVHIENLNRKIADMETKLHKLWPGQAETLPLAMQLVLTDSLPSVRVARCVRLSPTSRIPVPTYTLNKVRISERFPVYSILLIFLQGY